MSLIPAAILCAACSDGSGGSGAAAVATPAPVRELAYQSEKRAGGAIAVKADVLGDVVVNQPVAIELTFTGNFDRALWLEIADSDDYRIEGDYRRVVDADSDNGQLGERIELVPLIPGKHYLRLVVSRSGGQDPRAVVVALPVKDESGQMPEPDKTIKSRIDFKSILNQ